MGTNRGLLIRTVVVDGTEDSFKSALRRSILGVTFRKNKRYGNNFYQHRFYNIAVTDRLCQWLYEYLLAETPLQNISQFKVKAELFIKWDASGKIAGASGIKVSVYLKMGDLGVGNLGVQEEHEKVKIEFFYSDIDAASPMVSDQLTKIMESLGTENFEVTRYNFQNNEHKKVADSCGVNKVPTVIINDEKFENPNEKDLRSRIDVAFSPQIVAENASFILEPITDSIIEKLALTIKNYPKNL